MQAITLISGPFFYRVHKYQLPRVLGGIEVHIHRGFHFIREGRQFEVVRGKQRKRADFLTHMVRGGPGK